LFGGQCFLGGSMSGASTRTSAINKPDRKPVQRSFRSFGAHKALPRAIYRPSQLLQSKIGKDLGFSS
jgi:hypothetical protein